MADKCVVRYHCGTWYPGWLDGTHPTVAEGVVTRKVCYTANRCCDWSNNIKVKNCSSYYVYELQKQWGCPKRYCGNAGAVDGCKNYSVLSEASRAQTNTLRNNFKCDDNLVTGWYRFQGAAGDRMADKCVLQYRCGTQSPSWLNGTHPTVAEGVVTRKVCYYWGRCCSSTDIIKVKNCGSYYVYELLTSSCCNCRYCGDAGAAITCGPLVPPNDVIITPSSCLSSSKYAQTCRFTCKRPGYVLEGTSARLCGNDGHWTGSNDTRCRDNTLPSFNNTCPKNMVFYTAECSSTALLTWNEPIASDNSGHVSISYPAIRPPVNLSIGLYSVLYSATDSSGNQANCTFIVQVARKSCPVLQPPIHGSITSLSCGSSCGSQASLSCDAGYQMAGSSQRACQADGTWSGNTTLCNVVKCPGITPSSRVLVSPSICKVSSGVAYQTNCIFECNITVGYQLEGAQNVSCLENGTWSVDPTRTICRDIQPPGIQCPPDMEDIPTAPGKSYANVTWQVPVPTDNSNETLELRGPRPPQKLNLDVNEITYTATDSSGLSNNCMFFIRVKDIESPKITSCPGDVQKISRKRWNIIWLPEVTVKDNVGVHFFGTNVQNGSNLTWGKYNVTYTASDKAGNTAYCKFQLVILGSACDHIAPPLNGAKACSTWQTAGMFCTVHCNVGYGFVKKPEPLYICSPSGEWFNVKVPWKKESTLPDCAKTHEPIGAVVNGTLHYLTDECGGENMHEVIAGHFIQLLKNSPFGNAGVCQGQCTIDNVEVECGEQTVRRRRRDMKIPLTVKFAVKVPLPSNGSVVELKQTTQQLSSEFLAALNETDLNLNISGVVLEYDSSKSPVFRVIGLVCDKGQVLRETKCVNCPLGYFFNASGCQACATDHYQDQEAQTFCVSCPSGTSTFGQTGSRRSKDCQELPSTSNTGAQGMPKKILYPVVAVGSLVLIALIAVAVFCLRKRSLVNRKPKANTATRSYTGEENMGQPNPAYNNTASVQDNEPQYMEIGELQQRDVGFHDTHFNPGDHYKSLGHACGRSDHVYMGLNFSQLRQSQV